MAFEGLFWLDIPNTDASLLQGLPENFAFWQCQQPLVSLWLFTDFSRDTDAGYSWPCLEPRLISDEIKVDCKYIVDQRMTIECWANRCELHRQQDIGMKKKKVWTWWGEQFIMRTGYPVLGVKRRGSSSAMTITGQCLTWSFCASLFMWIQFI